MLDIIETLTPDNRKLMEKYANKQVTIDAASLMLLTAATIATLSMTDTKSPDLEKVVENASKALVAAG